MAEQFLFGISGEQSYEIFQDLDLAKERERLEMIRRLQETVRNSLVQTEADLIRKILEDLNKKSP